jgi:hypothetical protein
MNDVTAMLKEQKNLHEISLIVIIESNDALSTRIEYHPSKRGTIATIICPSGIPSKEYRTIHFFKQL